MSNVPLGRADYHREVAKEARIELRNRYFEENPVLTEAGVALISRPGLKRWLPVGDGPIRAIYSQPGSFDNSLFVVSGEGWYKVDRKTSVVTLLTLGLNPVDGYFGMAATGALGSTPEFMYLADGRNLWLYVENGFAVGTLSGSPTFADVINIGSVYYQFTTGSLSSVTANGSLADPWLVRVGPNDTASYANLAGAIDATGSPGVNYSVLLFASNPDAQILALSATSLSVSAKAIGALGNAVATTETGAGTAWTAATLTGGGAPRATIVMTPDDVGMIAVAYVGSNIICVPAQGEGINGRFYWISPGETTIDPLNFATAESAPDPIFNVIAFGDQFWLPGSSTTEVWYFTGNFNAPVARLQGVAFNRGTWEGAAIQIKESMVIVDSDGGVFQIAGGLQRISKPDIEQRIREAIQYQASRVF